MEFQHKLEAFGIYGWVAQFRLKPDTNRSLWQKIKDKIKLTYEWYPYIEFREDLHISGYDRWGTDLKYFDTPKMAKDYYMKHIFIFKQVVEQLLHSGVCYLMNMGFILWGIFFLYIIKHMLIF